MYAVTSTWLVSLTRATFRSAEFGFFGVVVYTRVHTPRRCGLPLSAGVFVLPILSVRPLRTNCWIVGMCWRLLPSRLRDEAELRLFDVVAPAGQGRACSAPREQGFSVLSLPSREQRGRAVCGVIAHLKSRDCGHTTAT